jgi:hypothetical protein
MCGIVQSDYIKVAYIYLVPESSCRLDPTHIINNEKHQGSNSRHVADNLLNQRSGNIEMSDLESSKKMSNESRRHRILIADEPTSLVLIKSALVEHEVLGATTLREAERLVI